MISQLTALPVLMGAPAGGGAQAGSMATTFITFGLIIEIFYFLIIRPQKKKERQTKEMLSALKKGDKVVSIGGIRGTVLAVREATIVVKVDDNTKIEFSKGAIASVLNAQVKSEPEVKQDPSPQQKAGKKPAAKKQGASKAKAEKAEPVKEEPADDQPEEDETKQQ